MKKLILGVLAIIVIAFSVVGIIPTRAYAAENTGSGLTTILSCPYLDDNGKDEEGKCIYWILNVVLTILTYGVGIAGVLGIAISGVQYLTARDNEAQVQKAKNRILQVVIGLAAYAVLWTALNWLIPGGLLNGS